MHRQKNEELKQADDVSSTQLKKKTSENRLELIRLLVSNKKLIFDIINYIPNNIKKTLCDCLL